MKKMTLIANHVPDIFSKVDFLEVNEPVKE